MKLKRLSSFKWGTNCLIKSSWKSETIQITLIHELSDDSEKSTSEVKESTWNFWQTDQSISLHRDLAGCISVAHIGQLDDCIHFSFVNIGPALDAGVMHMARDWCALQCNIQDLSHCRMIECTTQHVAQMPIDVLCSTLIHPGWIKLQKIGRHLESFHSPACTGHVNFHAL